MNKRLTFHEAAMELQNSAIALVDFIKEFKKNSEREFFGTQIRDAASLSTEYFRSKVRLVARAEEATKSLPEFRFLGTSYRCFVINLKTSLLMPFFEKRLFNIHEAFEFALTTSESDSEMLSYDLVTERGFSIVPYEKDPQLRTEFMQSLESLALPVEEVKSRISLECECISIGSPPNKLSDDDESKNIPTTASTKPRSIKEKSLTERQRKIYQFVQQEPRQIKQVVSEFNFSRKIVASELNKIMRVGLIKRHGDRGDWYVPISTPPPTNN